MITANKRRQYTEALATIALLEARWPKTLDSSFGLSSTPAATRCASTVPTVFIWRACGRIPCGLI